MTQKASDSARHCLICKAGREKGRFFPATLDSDECFGDFFNTIVKFCRRNDNADNTSGKKGVTIFHRTDISRRLTEILPRNLPVWRLLIKDEIINETWGGFGGGQIRPVNEQFIKTFREIASAHGPALSRGHFGRH